MSNFDYQQLVESTQGFSKSTLIGKGSHGSVFKAMITATTTNTNNIDNNVSVVAIKKSSRSGVDHVTNDNRKKLENEMLVLSSLSPSPYVINFLGTSYKEETNTKLLVMEFMSNGSLHDLLHVNGGVHGPPSWPKRVEIGIQIARAIQFLHESNKPNGGVIIHRDIKSDNILFDSNWNAKLTDFGLAEFINDSVSRDSPSQPAGTIGYMDPSYTTPNKLSTKVDIFSYGVVLLELISGRKAMDVTKTPSSIVEWAIPLIEERRELEVCDSRMPLPTLIMEGIIKQILYMASRCVSFNEENRPSMGEIVGSFDRFYMVEIERVKMPSWVGIIRSAIAMRKQRRWRIADTTAHKCEVKREVVSKGKVLLMDLLSIDITIKS